MINTNLIDTEIENDYKCHNNKKIVLFDIVEKNIIWDNSYTEDVGEWVGIIHITPVPKNLQAMVPKFLNIQTVLDNDKFISMLDRCKGLILLSKYLKDYLSHKLPENIPLKFIKHPVSLNTDKFNFNKFKCKKKFKIISIGQQLRYLTTIYRLNTIHEKLWLPGINRRVTDWHNLVLKEARFLGVEDIVNQNLNNVTIQRLNIKQYDKVITENIVVIHLINASANNGVLEMISTNTPFFINYIPPVVDYLGEDYPLYFNEIEEVEEIINNHNLLLDKFKKTNTYLQNLDKSDITTEHFNNEMFKLINDIK